MLNKRGQRAAVGWVFLTIFFMIALTVFATVDPLKENLDVSRGDSALNCPGTPNHNAVDYANDTTFEKLVRRPTCFVTGIAMVWFVVAVLASGIVWVGKAWGIAKR